MFEASVNWKLRACRIRAAKHPNIIILLLCCGLNTGSEVLLGFNTQPYLLYMYMKGIIASE